MSETDTESSASDAESSPTPTESETVTITREELDELGGFLNHIAQVLVQHEVALGQLGAKVFGEVEAEVEKPKLEVVKELPKK